MNLEKLIPVVNQLQDVFNTIGKNNVELPQIVVVGSQSSGKSSVLEGIVGKEFLPRGTGIVTRCPLIVQMTNAKDEYGEFLHQPGTKYTDFTDIRDEIRLQTSKITGTTKGITKQAIRLHIRSPHVLDLTVVDLPGITRVPVGDQPKDIEIQVKSMCLEFIRNPHSIILAVTAANTDIANSDALQLSKEVDPQGARTLGVITKLDLMDRGTDAADILNGNIIPLTHGFIGVVNRSQADLDSKLSISTARDQERDFFKTHPQYRKMMNRMGMDHLSQKLHNILMEHIKEYLPKVKKHIQDELLETSHQLDKLGDAPTNTTKDILTVISDFSNQFVKQLDGLQFSSNRLTSGAKIRQIFSTILKQELDQLNPFEELSDEEIRISIQNGTGIRTLLFFPESVFTMLMMKQIDFFEPVCISCVRKVYDEIQNAASECNVDGFKRYIKLKERVIEVTHSLLRGRLNPSLDAVRSLIHMEQSYINTNHQNFAGLTSSAISKYSKNTTDIQVTVTEHPPDSDHNSEFLEFIYSEMKQKQNRNESYATDDNSQVTMIKQFISSYFKIVKYNLNDYVPKAIMLNMINEMKLMLHATLVNELYGNEQSEELVQESSEVTDQREACIELLENLESALKIIQQIYDK